MRIRNVKTLDNVVATADHGLAAVNMTGLDCPICLRPFKDNQPVVFLSCGGNHFHCTECSDRMYIEDGCHHCRQPITALNVYTSKLYYTGKGNDSAIPIDDGDDDDEVMVSPMPGLLRSDSDSDEGDDFSITSYQDAVVLPPRYDISIADVLGVRAMEVVQEVSEFLTGYPDFYDSTMTLDPDSGGVLFYFTSGGERSLSRIRNVTAFLRRFGDLTGSRVYVASDGGVRIYYRNDLDSDDDGDDDSDEDYDPEDD